MNVATHRAAAAALFWAAVLVQASTVAADPIGYTPHHTASTFTLSRLNTSSLPSYLVPNSPTSGENTVLNTSTNTPTLIGTQTNQGAAVSYRVGTSTSSNPAVGLDFTAAGPVSYAYSIPIEVLHQAPENVATNHSYRIDPFLNLNGTPTLSATQDVAFYTTFSFALEVGMPWPIPDIDVDVAVNLPNLEYQGNTVTFEGNGSIGTSGSTATNLTEAGPGYFEVTTSTGSFVPDVPDGQTLAQLCPTEPCVAWETTADLINLASTIGGPQQPLLVGIDTLGFDLNQTVGMPIFREDQVVLQDYFFPELSIDIPDGWEINTPYQYSIDTVLTYDLLFQSRFSYSGQIELWFDGPFFDPVDIFNLTLPPFEVGAVNVLAENLTQQVTLTGEVMVTTACTQSGACTFAPDFDPYSVSDSGKQAFFEDEQGNWLPTSFLPPTPSSGTQTSLGYMTEASPEFVEYYQSVPEPSSLLLACMGLGMIGFFRRHGTS